MWSLERFEAAAATARKGELAALGTSPSGTLFPAISPRLCGARDKDTAMRKNDEGSRRLRQMEGLPWLPSTRHASRPL